MIPKVGQSRNLKNLATIQKAVDFAVFTKEVKKVYGDSFERVAPIICSEAANLAGEGFYKKVFNIKGVKDFLLAMVKTEYQKGATSKFEPIENPIPEHNFGQFIGKNNAGLYIMQRVSGESHSLPYWPNRFDAKFFDNIGFSNQEIQTVLGQIKQIEKFPVRAYEGFALQMGYLSKHLIKADAINPNNILVDSTQKSFNIIDVDAPQEEFQEMPKPLNGIGDMIALLLDSIFHWEYSKVMTSKDSETLGRAAKVIIEKCRIAARNTDTKAPESNTRLYMGIISEARKKGGCDVNFVEKYDRFVSMYKHLLDGPIY